MGRIKGMRKIDGVWYRPESIPMSTIAPAVKVPEIVSQSVTGVSEKASDTPKNYGTRLYSNDEIKRLEVQAGLACVGFAADDHGVQIPVLLRNDHSDDEKASKLAKIRKGI